MNISFLTPSISRQAGGFYESVRHLSRELNKSKDTIKVYSFIDDYTSIDDKSWLPIVPTTFKKRGPKKFGYSGELIQSIREDSPDILHQHGLWMYPSIVSSRLSSEGVKVMISPRGMLDNWAIKNSRLKKLLALMLFEKRNLHHADCIHALCYEEYDSIRKLGFKNPICIIPNGVGLPDVPVRAAPLPAWKRKLDQKKILLYLGRIHPKKGLSLLIDAWSQCPKNEKKNWVLVVAGWGQVEHEKKFIKQVSSVNINDDILFIGQQYGENKHACYKNADAFILPSFSEGLPMVILEAWSHGLPVLMTPHCNLSIGYSEGAAIKIYPENSSILEGIKELVLASTIQRTEIGKRGFNLIKKKFIWSEVANEMSLVYDWLSNQGKAPNSIKFE